MWAAGREAEEPLDLGRRKLAHGVGSLNERGGLILVQQEYLVSYRIHGASVSIAAAAKAGCHVRWAKECATRRRRGQAELSYEQFRDMLLWATVGVTIYSGVEYIVRGFRLLNARESAMHNDVGSV